MLGVFGFFLVLRIILACLEGVPWRTQFLVTLLGSTPYAVLLLPLATAMVASVMGQRVLFVPSNSRHARQHDHSLPARLGRFISTSLLLGLLLAGAVHRPGSLLVGFNFLWLDFLLLSPISLTMIGLIDRWNHSRIATSSNPSQQGEIR
jgi:hypothetical protein